MATDPYADTPYGTYDSRRDEFLDFAVGSYDPERRGRAGLFAQICHLEKEVAFDDRSVYEALRRVDERRDCSDFTVSGLLRVLYKYTDQIDPSLIEAIRKTVIGFKYWMDEPGHNTMCFISENHQIMFHSDEYLAGQLYPLETFADGCNGEEHLGRARRRILRWIDLKAKTGFSEWDSNVYYDEDMAPLINLVDFADDEEIATRSAMILDVLFFDMAIDSFKGTYGTTHGRSYPRSIVSGRTENTSCAQRIAWGMGCYNNPANMTAVMLATSRKYRVPEVIEKIAKDMPDEMINKERQSYSPEDFAWLGIRFDDPDSAHLAWVVAKMATLENVESLLELTEKHPSKWFDEVLRPLILRIHNTYIELERRGEDPQGQLDFLSLPTINKICYRTPDYQLSAAQDYRKGEPAWHQHLWQATLGPDAIVFTMHRSDDFETPSRFWAGRFPRIAQHQNLLIAIYDIPEHPILGPGSEPIPESVLIHQTIAYFPRVAFDEVVERSGWVFGRKDQGYVALRSQNPTEWCDSVLLGQEGLVATGRRNVWLCGMGRESVDGRFEDWYERIESASLTFGDRSVEMSSTAVGEVSFSWSDPLTVDGLPIELADYPRFANPYCRVERGGLVYDISHADQRIRLDFENGRRHES